MVYASGWSSSEAGSRGQALGPQQRAQRCIHGHCVVLCLDHDAHSLSTTYHASCTAVLAAGLWFRTFIVWTFRGDDAPVACSTGLITKSSDGWQMEHILLCLWGHRAVGPGLYHHWMRCFAYEFLVISSRCACFHWQVWPLRGSNKASCADLLIGFLKYLVDFPAGTDVSVSLCCYDWCQITFDIIGHGRENSRSSPQNRSL